MAWPAPRRHDKQISVSLRGAAAELVQRLAEERQEPIAVVVRRALAAQRLELDEREASGRRPAESVESFMLTVPNPPLENTRAEVGAPLPATSMNLGLLGPDGMPLSPTSHEGQEVLIHVTSVSQKLIAEVADDPTKLHQLSGGKFEELVAELLFSRGYTISRVPPGPDGGVDIYAAQKSELGQFLYLVQCKRWSSGNPVGIDVVQRLHGRVEADKATAGVVVTTSRFTKPAMHFADLIPMRMGLRDYNDLLSWLHDWRIKK